MSTSLTTPATDLSTVVNAQLLTEYLDAMGLAQKLTAQEKIQFLQIAQAYQLNPFKREIYATKYGDGGQLSIIVGYETYLKRAERTGQLDGWTTQFSYDEAGALFSCTITIWRKDRSREFTWEVFYDEQVQYTNAGKISKFWQKGRQQLRKVAISQGMRLAFPDELGGMPYTDDELPPVIQDTTAEVVHEAQPVSSASKPAVASLTKKQAADALKNGTTPDQFIFDRIDEYRANIDKATDSASWDWNEAIIGCDKNLPDGEKTTLLKESIMHRTGKVVSVDQAEAVKKRIKGWAKVLGTANVEALLLDLIEQAGANGIKYENKTFYRPEPTSEELAQALADNG